MKKQESETFEFKPKTNRKCQKDQAYLMHAGSGQIGY